jgi:hypothetical protein
MRKDGVVAAVGEDRFFRLVEEAVAAAEEHAGRPGSRQEANS